mmetsp:Transcript_317/g.1481  ORF Transcript_317/g.1481 Transcript_317/m.1481 type:complete len:309 (+) Transcript_317:876-1802(+)
MSSSESTGPARSSSSASAFARAAAATISVSLAALFFDFLSGLPFPSSVAASDGFLGQFPASACFLKTAATSMRIFLSFSETNRYSGLNILWLGGSDIGRITVVTVSVGSSRLNLNASRPDANFSFGTIGPSSLGGGTYGGRLASDSGFMNRSGTPVGSSRLNLYASLPDAKSMFTSFGSGRLFDSMTQSCSLRAMSLWNTSSFPSSSNLRPSSTGSGDACFASPGTFFASPGTFFASPSTYASSFSFSFISARTLRRSAKSNPLTRCVCSMSPPRYLDSSTDSWRSSSCAPGGAYPGILPGAAPGKSA